MPASKNLHNRRHELDLIGFTGLGLNRVAEQFQIGERAFLIETHEAMREPVCSKGAVR